MVKELANDLSLVSCFKGLHTNNGTSNRIKKIITHLEFGVALRLVDDEGVLLNEVSLLLFLGLPRLELLLDLLDQPEGRVQVGAWGSQFARFLLVGATEGPARVEKSNRSSTDSFRAAVVAQQ